MVKHCVEHGKIATYCPEEYRWICEDCEPEKMGYFQIANGVKLDWGDD